MSKFLILSTLLTLSIACSAEDSAPTRSGERSDDIAEQFCMSDEGDQSVGTVIEGLTCTSDGNWYEEICESFDGVPYARPEEGCSCFFNGNPYPPGTMVGKFTCTGDGAWYEQVCETFDGEPYERPEEGCPCFFNGDPYPPGTMVGEFECIDGVWLD